MIDVKVDIEPITRAFDRLRRTDGRKVFREARKPMRIDIREHAKAKAGPDGAWQPLAASTKDRRKRAGRKRGKLLAALPAAFKIASGPDFVRAEWLVKWSRVHWRGGRAGHGSRIVKRDFAYLSKSAIRAIRDLYVDALDRAWGGKR